MNMHIQLFLQPEYFFFNLRESQGCNEHMYNTVKINLNRFLIEKKKT